MEYFVFFPFSVLISGGKDPLLQSRRFIQSFLGFGKTFDIIIHKMFPQPAFILTTPSGALPPLGVIRYAHHVLHRLGMPTQGAAISHIAHSSYGAFSLDHTSQMSKLNLFHKTAARHLSCLAANSTDCYLLLWF